MAEARFEKVSRSDTPLYGPRKMVLCGFGRDAQPRFKTVLEMAGLGDLPLVWVSARDRTAPLAELFERPADSGEGVGSALPRALIMAGITENELHRLMDICRRTGMRNALWAALTPTSESWPLETLLAELSAERRQFDARPK